IFALAQIQSMGNTGCLCKKDSYNQELVVGDDPRKPKSALHVTIHSLSDYTPIHSIRIQCALTEENIIILDENGFRCTYNTAIHKPPRLSTALESQAQSHSENQIIFNESTTFQRDLNWILEN